MAGVVLKGVEGVVAAAAGGIDAAMKGGEGLGVLGDGFARAVGVGDGSEALVILAIPGGGIGGIAADRRLYRRSCLEELINLCWYESFTGLRVPCT
ncbi:MAG: hypothetical protein ABI806_27250 [Candidatus Solibacter sp.]